MNFIVENSVFFHTRKTRYVYPKKDEAHPIDPGVLERMFMARGKEVNIQCLTPYDDCNNYVISTVEVVDCILEIRIEDITVHVCVRNLCIDNEEKEEEIFYK